MKIPWYIIKTIEVLEQAGYEAYAVGGCVRDSLLGREPKDWDVTTNAKPEAVLALLPDSKYENIFGTVIVPFKNGEAVTEFVVEVTTFRSEQGYSDRRHPDQVIFEETLDKDLARRDFTINAMALRLLGERFKVANLERNDYILLENEFEIIDIFGGQKDLHKRVIRAVGEPTDRFREDALRMMRAIRFSAQLGFEIEDKTKRGITKLAGSIKFVANERIHDELIKILESDRPHQGIMNLHETKMLQYILPELEAGVGLTQNKHHRTPIFEHCMDSLKYCPSKIWQVRLAALLHDIGKVPTRKLMAGDYTFYNHEYAGFKLTQKIMKRLKFSVEDSTRIANLVKNHMFYYNVDEVTAAAVRRLIVKVGKENLKDLIDLRIGDRLGSGVAKAKPYKLRHLEYMFDLVQNDAVSVKMLKINGDDLMKDLGIEPGIMIGAILDVLLSDVIDNPEYNTRDWLLERSRELLALPIEELRFKARELIEEKRGQDEKKIKNKHYVK